MDPAKYQRPQEPPTEGNIAQAEKLVEEMGIQKSLIRRYAELSEIEKLWVPNEAKEEDKKPGDFSHLIPKKEEEPIKLNVPTQKMTWRKFSEKVLPLAEKMEINISPSPQNFGAIITAAYFDAPPIIKWDKPDKRNPFSWYLYKGGSNAREWGLAVGYNSVTAVCIPPCNWYANENRYAFGDGIFFILDGAKDTKYKEFGCGLFPEILKSELYPVRATIEAYSNKSVLEGYEKSSACGLVLGDGFAPILLKVTINSLIESYIIDRLD
jgi:hypothetical protein